MELYEEYYNNKKKSKLPMIIGISIAILVIITILIIYGIIYLKSTVTKITLDGADASALEKIFYIEETENGSELYIPIRKIAQYLGYEDYSGDYKYKSEDKRKCYVKNEYETAMFTLDSNIIVKTRGDSDYEYVEIDKKVFEKDGELYTTIDGITKAYNVEFDYNSKNKDIKIYTMDYLVQYFSTKLKIEEYEADFSDKKAIFENMLIVQGDNKQYGVVNASTGESILETKYDLVKYLPNTTDFLVKSNGKYGVVSKEAINKVKITYDEIKIMDNEHGLYLVRANNLYGVINTEGNVIIAPEYQQIGINTSSFAQNGIESQYILLDELIPIRNNNLWGFFNLKGEQITEFEYTGLGCTISKVASSYPLLVVPSYKLIVVEKNKFYNLIKTDGSEIINGYVLDSAYMRTNTETGENKFYMTFNGNTLDIEEKMLELGEE